MGQNLTQPEEIDRILRDMADQDMKAGKPVPGVNLSGDDSYDAQYSWQVGLAGHSNNVVQKKLMG